MILRWIRNRRRKKLASRPFPPAWLDILHRNVAVYPRLTRLEQAKLRNDVRIFTAEKNWEGCGGLQLTDEIRVTIAAQMGLLVLGFPSEYFEQVLSVLIYPNAYSAPDQKPASGGVVLVGQSDREGEAWYRGPVILSWADVLTGAKNIRANHNLVLHEFAHQLDMQNGQIADGVPPLDSSAQLQQWLDVTEREFQRLIRDCGSGQQTVLDCYGTTNRAEFFAVSTESFFQRPAVLKLRHPDLYQLLQQYYRQDPAARNGVH